MSDIEKAVLESISEILAKKNVAPAHPTSGQALVFDLGMDSMDLAMLVAILEAKTGDDPFAERVSIGSIRTVADLCAAYGAC